jgi:uncharacterized protein YgiM (DUF1202 family)
MSDTFKLSWPVDSRQVNQFFGVNPDFYAKFGLAGHEGLDLRAPTEANVYAAADGEVYFVGHPDNHPYGLFIRIKHDHQGKVYRTIYAHLQEVFVQLGQKVKVGDRIGLADNTGNSFGSHLHFSLVLDGASSPGYPAGVIDPWPYLHEAVPVVAENTPPPSDLVVYTLESVNLRAQPNTSGEIRGLIGVSEPLTVLGDAAVARANIGRDGQWLQVQTASRLTGYVAAWFVEAKDKVTLPSGITVYPTMKLNVRKAGSLQAEVVGTVLDLDALTVLGDNAAVQAAIGQKNQWLQIITEKGLRGYVAAEGVRLTGEVAARCGLTVYPTDVLNLRARDNTNSNILTMVTPSDVLNVLGDIEQAYSKIGQPNEWLNVQTGQGLSGYVAAQFVQTAEEAAFAPTNVPYLTVYAASDLILHAQAARRSPEVGHEGHGVQLYVIEQDLAAAEAKVGQAGWWLYVELENGTRGWVLAEQLKLEA